MNIFLPAREHDLFFRKTVTCWDEAIPLGSGLTGSLIWGDGEPLRFSLDRGDLWDNRPAKEVLAPDYTYEELIKLVRERNQEEILRRFDKFYNQPTPTKIPAGRLELSFGKAADNVESRLSLARAEAEITLHFGEDTASVSSFMHAGGKYGFLRVTGRKPTFRIFSHDFTPMEDGTVAASALSTGSTHHLGYPPVERMQIGRVQIALQHTCEELSFALMAASAERDGATEIAYCIISSNDGENWLEAGARKLEEALDAGYHQAIQAHLLWWEGFWGKSRISLPDKVLEKNWYMTNYLLASCSRKGCPPMPAQGVWTADDGMLPPWKGDYHGDLNTQLDYSHFLKADHLEEGESFLDFMWSLNGKAREFAKSFFDADGICLPSVFGFDGTSLGGWPMYATNITNQIWQDQVFYLYYKYTGDEDFLTGKLYPYLRETEAVVRRHFVRDENGRLTLPLSSSPEIHDNELASWLDPISSYDLSLLHFLYDALTELAPLVRPADLPLWRETRAQLPDLPVDPDFGYMMTAKENLTESHRHLSHLMAIHPLNLCRYHRSEEEKTIIDNSLHHLEVLGHGYWIGYSFTWAANLYAKTLNGEAAAWLLRTFTDCLCSQNSFHLNGDFRLTGATQFHYRPFTLESNMNSADATQEMLMQCYDDCIRVFPAIPERWRDEGCEFEGLLSYGGVKVSAAIQNGKVAFVHLNPRKDYTASIYNPFASSAVRISSSEGDFIVQAAPGEPFSLPLRKGIQYTLTE